MIAIDNTQKTINSCDSDLVDIVYVNINIFILNMTNNNDIGTLKMTITVSMADIYAI